MVPGSDHDTQDAPELTHEVILRASDYRYLKYQPVLEKVAATQPVIINQGEWKLLLSEELDDINGCIMLIGGFLPDADSVIRVCRDMLASQGVELRFNTISGPQVSHIAPSYAIQDLDYSYVHILHDHAITIDQSHFSDYIIDRRYDDNDANIDYRFTVIKDDHLYLRASNYNLDNSDYKYLKNKGLVVKRSTHYMVSAYYDKVIGYHNITSNTSNLPTYDSMDDVILYLGADDYYQNSHMQYSGDRLHNTWCYPQHDVDALHDQNRVLGKNSFPVITSTHDYPDDMSTVTLGSDTRQNLIETMNECIKLSRQLYGHEYPMTTQIINFKARVDKDIDSGLSLAMNTDLELLKKYKTILNVIKDGDKDRQELTDMINDMTKAVKFTAANGFPS
jgi:hypothetical protein